MANMKMSRRATLTLAVADSLLGWRRRMPKESGERSNSTCTARDSVRAARLEDGRTGEPSGGNRSRRQHL
jgi:hypothetical protein